MATCFRQLSGSIIAAIMSHVINCFLNRYWLVKTVGLTDVIRNDLKKFYKDFGIAFIYGSIAHAEELSNSDVDLKIIDRVQLLDLAPSIKRLEKALGREVNPTIYRPQEFVKRLKKGDEFLKTVLADQKIYL